MAWAVGEQLQGGRYRIEAVLGEGGFGITYRAWDSVRADQVVIKVLNDSLREDPDYPRFQQNFMNEALQLARCHHPHVVKVEEVIWEQERWCIVMEYIRGQTLHQLLRQKGPLPLPEALRLTREVGSALMALHEQGILHRDVKPSNIMVREGSQQAVLIDFGLARGYTQGLIQRHTSYGTDGYAPLEQYDSLRRRGAFTDVYALAATLYTALTGMVPMCAPVRATGRQLDTPRSLNPNIPEVVEAAILKGMALHPEERPQTMAEWLALLPAEASQEERKRVAFEPAIHTQELRELEQVLAQTPEPQDGLEQLLASHSAEELEQLVAPPTPPTVKRETGPGSLIFPEVCPEGQGSREGSQPGTLSWPEWVGEAAPALQGLWDRLQAGQWGEADRWTTALMLKLSGRSQVGFFDPKDIQAFPCPMLRLIDQLWVRASQGRFGFSVQKQLWQGCDPGGTSIGRSRSFSALPREECMGEAVGWRIQGRWLGYGELKTSLDAPPGHLPVGFFWGYSGGLRSALLTLDRVVLKKLKACF
ncbi:serine/threonine-protein kinase [Synechococcus sp. R55.2]|uniref:serine/threonine-protein kinase n=1 Tax=Synechococcus sp. R55.2 TaxID=2964496 RepID=UPI0039C2C891